MLRKLIFFAITSGLAKKAFDAYMRRPANRGPAPTTGAPPVRDPASVRQTS